MTYHFLFAKPDVPTLSTKLKGWGSRWEQVNAYHVPPFLPPMTPTVMNEAPGISATFCWGMACAC